MSKIEKLNNLWEEKFQMLKNSQSENIAETFVSRIDYDTFVFEDIWQIISGHFVLWGGKYPLKMDKDWVEYLQVWSRRYYDINNIGEDQKKMSHVYRVGELSAFIWDRNVNFPYWDWVYLVMKYKWKCYDIYDAKMKKPKDIVLKGIIQRVWYATWNDMWQNNKSNDIWITSELVERFLDWNVTDEEKEAVCKAAKQDTWLNDILMFSVGK